MRCDEIQDRFVDLLYNEKGTPSASPELQAHIDSCESCRRELEGLKSTRTLLNLWADEPLPRPVRLPVREYAHKSRRTIGWRPLRFAAIAAMILIAFLVLANADVTWNKDGFSYRNHLLSRGASQVDVYTKAQTRDLLKRVLDDSESRINETNYLMMQELLRTVEQDRMLDLRLVRHQGAPNRNKN